MILSPTAQRWLAAMALLALAACEDRGASGDLPDYSGDLPADTGIFVEEMAVAVASCNDTAARAEQGWQAHSQGRLSDRSAIVLAEDAIATCDDSLAVMEALAAPPSAEDEQRQSFDKARQECRSKFKATRDYVALIPAMIRREASPEQEAGFAQSYRMATSDSGPCAQAILTAGERGGLSWRDINDALTAANARLAAPPETAGR